MSHVVEAFCDVHLFLALLDSFVCHCIVLVTYQVVRDEPA